MTSRRSVLAAGATAGIASIAGCFGGGSGGDGPLKIGFVLPYSGTYQLLGESITNGFKLRASELDESLGGRDVEYLRKDTEADPDAGVSVTREFLTEEQVDFLVGPVSSAVAGAMAPRVNQEGNAIWINANAGNNDLVKNCVTKYHFRTSFSNWHGAAPLGPWVYENVSDRAYLSYADYTAGQQYKANFAETFEEAGGTIVGEVAPPLGTKDYSPYLQKMADSDAEAIYSFFAGGDAVNYIKQLHEFGIDEEMQQTGAGFLLSQDTIPAQSNAAMGKYTIHHYTPTKQIEKNQAFVEAYQGEHDRMPNVYACAGYDSATAIDNAISEQGTTDPDSLVDSLEGMELDSPRGAMTIDAERHDPNHELDIRKVVEGSDGKPKNEVVESLGRKKVPWTCDF